MRYLFLIFISIVGSQLFIACGTEIPFVPVESDGVSQNHDAQNEFMEDRAHLMDRAILLRNDIQRVLNNPALFDHPDLAGLKTDLATVGMFIDAVRADALACAR